ncbi:hypothetical protein AAVH_35001, partial [Aphelenchoides avenae]
MRRGLPEDAAKKATIAFSGPTDVVVADIYLRHRTAVEADDKWNRLDGRIRNWRAIADVERLLHKGPEPAVAIQLRITADEGKTAIDLANEYRATRMNYTA